MLVFVLLVVGSVGLFYYTLPREISPSLLPYVEEYVRDANKYGHPITMKHIHYVGYSKLWGKTIGFGLSPNVLIDPAWAYKNKGLVKELVYHELSHAVFKCGHSSSTYSIMYPEIGWLSEVTDWDSAVESLFTTEFKELECEEK